MGYDEESGNSLIWFLAGLSIGALVALLYAPRSGRETRRYISKKADEARDFVSERGQELYDRGRELAEEASELVERGRKLAKR